MTALTKTTLIDFMLGEFTVVESNKIKKLVVLLRFQKAEKTAPNQRQIMRFALYMSITSAKMRVWNLVKRSRQNPLLTQDALCTEFG